MSEAARSAQPDGYLRARPDGTFTASSSALNSRMPFRPARPPNSAPCSRCGTARGPCWQPRRPRPRTRPRSPGCAPNSAAATTLPCRLRAAEPVLAAAHRPDRPGHRRAGPGPDPAAAGRVRRRPVRPAGLRPGGVRPGRPAGRQGVHLPRTGHRPARAAPRRRHPGRRAGDLPGRPGRAAAGRDRPPARHHRGRRPRPARHARVRRPGNRAAGPRRRVPVRQRPRQAAASRTGGRGRLPVRGQRHRTAPGHPARPDAGGDRRPARRRLDRRDVRPAVPARDPRRPAAAGRASRRADLGGPRRPAHRARPLHLGHQPLPGTAARAGPAGTAQHRGPRHRHRCERPGPFGPQRRRDAGRAGESRRTGRTVLRLGLGGPGPRGRAGPHLQRPVQQPGAAQLRRRPAVPARPGPDLPAPAAPGRRGRPDDRRARGAAGPRGRRRQDRRDDHGRDRAAAARPGPQARGRRPEPHARAVRPRMAPALPAGQGADRRAARTCSRDRRREFVARCATGTWDGIVMSRSAFERIPLSAREQQQPTWTASSTRCASWIEAAKSAATASRSRGWKARCCAPRNGCAPSWIRPRTRASPSRRPASTTCASTRRTGTRTCAPPPTSATRRSTGPCAPPTWT